MFRTVKTISELARSCCLLTARHLLPGMLLVLWSPFSVPAAEPPQEEYQVKAAFLYNFARFTSWPEHGSSAFTLCVLGDDPFNNSLDTLTGKTINDKTLSIIHQDYPSDLDGCELVYISTSHAEILDEVIAQLREQAVLTVSDIVAFVDHGGIIGFRVIDNKIRFEINTTAAAAAGLSISSRLLSLASRIEKGR